MDSKELISFIEDKKVSEKSSWYLHATQNKIETIKKILNEGIKAACLRDDDIACGFNGLYYISLFKNNLDGSNLSKRFEDNIKIIVDGINPYYADKSKESFRRFLINTRIPLRTSEWYGEYQQYLKIDPRKFVGLDYHLSRIIQNLYGEDRINKLLFLRDVVCCIKESNPDLPIYDLASSKELNQDKILSLKL